MGTVLGIDLGTTYSAIAVINDSGYPEIIPNREGERITPSVVFFDGGDPIVGTLAKQSAGQAPLNVVQFVKRQMGTPSWRFRTEEGESFSAEEIAAIILRRLKEDAEVALGEPVTEAVVTVPAYFDDAQRKATQDAGKIAGINVRRIINEPTAAALAYSFDAVRHAIAKDNDGQIRLAEQNVLVYDLGGGTFDVTIMRISRDGVNVIATGGDKNLGGFDWDNELMRVLNEAYKSQTGVDLSDDPALGQQLREKAEIAKKTLSSRDKATVLLAGGGKTASVVITREEFDSVTESLIKRTANIMGFVLEDSGLKWDAVDTLLLTGGSTRMRAVSAMIERVSGKKPSSALHPDEIVAMGAAIQGILLGSDNSESTNLPVVRATDVNSHSMGVVALKDDGQQANSIVLNKNTPIPCEANGRFHTVEVNQTAIHVQVTEGEDTDLNFVKIVGDGEMAIPPYPREAPIDVHFAYDHDGIIHVRVFDVTGQKWLGELHIQRTSNLNDYDIEEKRIKLSQREIN
jgi:molecular chaperone DnaK